ncbi:hypothetical protein EJ04DRAFT_554159 [Polyplosphaeria fusca]|uniref:Uncharacterized protein n=1 Tax=Polyplosphaeria fusca TaxID=682080 RepID=A0A9P4QW11_9PLEO|nr:hypothetical protein EJ04DRAFT_554159 [Polyplosphaeria fusca]
MLLATIAMSFDHGTTPLPGHSCGRGTTKAVQFTPELQRLKISYTADARISTPKSRAVVITHVQYQICLPGPWRSFKPAERYAILGEFYLCPHVYASKLQYRDPNDCTYPADSSISHSLPETIPDCQLTCPACLADFRAQFLQSEGSIIVIDVWRELSGGCNDGFKDRIYCSPAIYSGGSLHGHSGKIRAAYDAAETF